MSRQHGGSLAFCVRASPLHFRRAAHPSWGNCFITLRAMTSLDTSDCRLGHRSGSPQHMQQPIRTHRERSHRRAGRAVPAADLTSSLGVLGRSGPDPFLTKGHQAGLDGKREGAPKKCRSGRAATTDIGIAQLDSSCLAALHTSSRRRPCFVWSALRLIWGSEFGYVHKSAPGRGAGVKQRPGFF